MAHTRFRRLTAIAAGLVLATTAALATMSATTNAAPAAAATSTGALGPLDPTDVVYQILTDRFADGNTGNNVPPGFDRTLFDDPDGNGIGNGTDLKLYQGGDFHGIIDKIAYLKDMGITAVWISAPYANRDTVIEDAQPNGSVDRWTSFHGYHVRNYYATNKHFGTLRQFEQLRDALHANGIKLVIDFVTNHTSRWQNPTRGFVAEDGRLYEPDRLPGGSLALDANGEPYDYNSDGRLENLIADPHNDTSGWFHGLGDRGGDSSRFGYRHRDLGSLADFSQENAQVAAYLEGAATFWKARGVDGFRHDATLHMNPAFARNLRDAIDTAPGGPVSHFGEFFIGRPDPKYGEYESFPDRTGINNLDFEYYRASTNAFGSFSEGMDDFGAMLVATSNDYAYENQAVTFIDNHDVTRFRYIQPNDRPYHAALATLMTSRGTPNIYYGTEQYVSSADASDIAGRVFMQRATSFSTTTTAYRLISSLAGLRRSNYGLAYGLTTVLYSTDDVLVFSRKFYGHEVVVAVNRQPNSSATVPALATTLPNATYPDHLAGLLAGAGVTVAGGVLPSFVLSGGEVDVWTSTPGLGTATPRIGDVTSSEVRPGATLVVAGTGLGGTPSATVGGVPATVTSASDRQLTLTVATNTPAGEQPVVVTKAGTASNSFTVDVLTGDLNQVVFTVQANTTPGQQIHIVGNVAELGSWNVAQSTEAMLNPNYPQWFLPVSLPVGRTIQYKFIRKDSAGNVVWEGGSNRTITTSSATAGTVSTPVLTFQP